MFGKRLDSYQSKNLGSLSKKGLSSLVLTLHFTDDTKVQWEQGSAKFTQQAELFTAGCIAFSTMLTVLTLP